MQNSMKEALEEPALRRLAGCDDLPPDIAQAMLSQLHGSIRKQLDDAIEAPAEKPTILPAHLQILPEDPTSPPPAIFAWDP